MYGRSHYRVMGDPLFGGLFRRIGRVAKKGLRFGSRFARFLPGPFGTIGAALTGGQPGCPPNGAMMGDPFLGGLGPLIGRAAAAAAPVIGRVATAIRGGAATPLGRAAMTGAAFTGGAQVARRLLGGGGGEDEGPRRYRRMNVANIRALRRSIRRVKGFAKVARESITIAKKVKVRRKRA